MPGSQLAAPVSRKSEMIVPEDMHNLRAWYEHRYAKQGASRFFFRSASLGCKCRPVGKGLSSHVVLDFVDAQLAPKLVVLIEDLEAMDGKVLTQIIDTLS